MRKLRISTPLLATLTASDTFHFSDVGLGDSNSVSVAA